MLPEGTVRRMFTTTAVRVARPLARVWGERELIQCSFLGRQVTHVHPNMAVLLLTLPPAGGENVMRPAGTYQNVQHRMGTTKYEKKEDHKGI